MIKFEHKSGDLQTAVFSGSIEELCADIALQLSLIYGGMVERDKDAAKQFQRNIQMMILDPDITKEIFSDKLYDGIKESGAYFMGSLDDEDKENIVKALMELLG